MTELINTIERKLTYTTIPAALIVIGFTVTSLLFLCLMVSGDMRQLTWLFTAHVLGALYTYRYMIARVPETPMGALVTVLFVLNGFTALYIPLHVTAGKVWQWCSKRKGGSGVDSSNKVYVVLYFNSGHAYIDNVYKDRDAAMGRIKLLFDKLSAEYGEEDKCELYISRDGTLAGVSFHGDSSIDYALREQEVL